jgi:hypothetical protein
MKSRLVIRLLTVMVVFCSFNNSMAQKNDWQKEGLKGRVKSEKLYDYYDAQKYGDINPLSINKNDTNFRMIIRYDLKGKLLGWEGRNGKKLLVCNYDQSGNMSSQMKYDGKGNLIHRDTFKYDDKANLIEHTGTRLEKDTSRFKYVYKYDEKGNQLEFENNSISHNFYQKFVYKYDDMGHKIEDVEYDNNGQYNMMWIYKYDEHGNKTEMDLYGDSLIYKQYFKYDENGSIIEGWRWYGDNSMWDHFYYTVEYDEEGNWIKKVCTDNTEGPPVRIRVIEYYK